MNDLTPVYQAVGEILKEQRKAVDESIVKQRDDLEKKLADLRAEQQSTLGLTSEVTRELDGKIKALEVALADLPVPPDPYDDTQLRESVTTEVGAMQTLWLEQTQRIEDLTEQARKDLEDGLAGLHRRLDEIPEPYDGDALRRDLEADIAEHRASLERDLAALRQQDAASLDISEKASELLAVRIESVEQKLAALPAPPDPYDDGHLRSEFEAKLAELKQDREAIEVELRKRLDQIQDVTATRVRDAESALAALPEIPEAYDDADLRKQLEDARERIEQIREADADRVISVRRLLEQRLKAVDDAIAALPAPYDDAEMRGRLDDQGKALDELTGAVIELQEHHLRDADLDDLRDRIDGLKAGLVELRETAATKATVSGLEKTRAEARRADLDILGARVAEVRKDLIDATHDLSPAEIAKALVKDQSLAKMLRGDQGIGLQASPWVKGGVYRKGALVQHDFGRLAMAKKDTYAEPGKSDDWERVGSCGMRWCGVKKDGRAYQAGDLYIHDGTVFLVLEDGAEGKMFCKRPRDGKDGLPGRDGADAPRPAELRMVDDYQTLALVWDDGTVSEAQLPEGIKFVVEAVAYLKDIQGDLAKLYDTTKALNWIDSAIMEGADPMDIPVYRYRGVWRSGTSYQRGDTVTFNKRLYIAPESVSGDQMRVEDWVMMGGGGGGGGAVPKNVRSPFNVVNVNAAIPTQGAGAGDTYFSFQDNLLRVWDDTAKQWVVPGALAQIVADEAAVFATSGAVEGLIRFALADRSLWVYDGTAKQWRRNNDIIMVDDEAARKKYPAARLVEGQLLSQRDDDHLWMWDGAAWRRIATTITVADATARLKIPSASIEDGQLVYQADTGEMWMWHGNAWVTVGGGGGVTHVADQTALFAASAAAVAANPPTVPVAIPAGPAVAGDLYYQDDTGTLYIRNTVAAAGNAGNWDLVGSGSVKHAIDETELKKWPDRDLPTGQLVYVDDIDGQGTFGLIRRNANARKHTLADFEIIIPQAASSPLVIVSKAANLPTTPLDGVTYIIREDDAGNPLGRAYVWDKQGGPLVGGVPAQPPTGGVPPGYLMEVVTTIPGGFGTDFGVEFDIGGAATIADQATVDFDIVLSTGGGPFHVTAQLHLLTDLNVITSTILNAIDQLPGFAVTELSQGVLGVTLAAGMAVQSVTATVSGPAAQPPGYTPAIPAKPAGAWIQADQRTYLKATQGAVDEGAPLRPGDLQATTEVDHAELKVWDGTAWQLLFSEDEIKEWIAAGSLFQGTVNIMPQAGSDGLLDLPTPAPSNRGNYWTWTGPPNFEVTSTLVDPNANEVTISIAPTPPWSAGTAITITFAVAGGADIGVARSIFGGLMVDQGAGVGDEFHGLKLDLDATDTAADIAAKFIAAWPPGQFGITVAAGANPEDVVATPAAQEEIKGVGMAPDGQTPNIGADLGGETLQVGDWIQSNGVRWIHVASDLLSKLRGDRLYGLLPWADGNWEAGALVYFDEGIYRARSPVATGDAAPSVPLNPVVIAAGQLDPTPGTVASIAAWAAANPPTTGNAGRWVMATAAGAVALPGGRSLAVVSGDAVMNTGNPAIGTGGWVNVGQVSLPPIVAAHDVNPGTGVGPIVTQGQMAVLGSPGPAMAGTWAEIGAGVNPPVGVTGGPLPPGSTIMVLEDVSQGDHGYSVIRPVSGVPIVQSSNPGHPTSPGARALVLDQNALVAIANSHPSTFATGQWMAVLGPGPYTATSVPQTNNNLVGNLDAVAPTLQQGDALVLARLGDLHLGGSNAPVWARMPAAGLNTNPQFIGTGGTVTQYGGTSAKTPPDPVHVPARQPLPSTAPSYTYVPTASASKWERLELRTGIIAISDDSQLPVTPPTEDTLIFIANSARMNGNPALMRWDVASNQYIDIVARAEHPIVVYPSVAVMKASAPTLPNALGYAVQEDRWGTWTGPSGPGQQGSWSVDEYWSTVRGNMAWVAQEYQSGAIVYYAPTNSFYRATQLVPDTIPAPNSAASAAYWQQIGGGSTGGSRVFFGKGDYDLSDTTAANNWGMPAGTFPANIQPQNGDAYYDVLTGTTVQFTVTQNPTTNQISGRVDKTTATNMGSLSLGVVAGKVNFLTFNEDGAARAIPPGDYYTLTVPANFDVTGGDSILGGNYEDWVAPQNWVMPVAPALGYTIYIGATAGANIPQGTGTPFDGRYFPHGTAFLWTNLPWYSGTDGQGTNFYSGWMEIPNYAGGSTHKVYPVAAPSTGHFNNKVLFSRNYLVVWTGDQLADNGGWAILDDVAPYDWTLTTPQPRPQPDTISGTVNWGFVRRFTATMPNNVNANDIMSLVINVPEDSGIFNIRIIGAGGADSAYQFLVASAASSSFIVSPVLAYAKNNQVKAVGMLAVSGKGHICLQANTTAIRGKTFEVIVESHSEDLAALTAHVARETQGWGKSSYFDGLIDYPGEALTEALKAISGDVMATLPGNLQPGQDANGTTISAQDGKVTNFSGYWKLPTYVAGAETAFIRLMKGNNPVADSHASNIKGQDIQPSSGNNFNSINQIRTGGSPGFMKTSGTNAAAGQWHRFEVSVDRRAPSRTTYFFQCWYKASNDIAHYFWYQLEFAAANAPDRFYFSGYTVNLANWEVYKDL